MTEKWCGSIVSIDCGNVLGVYEGEVSSVDSVKQTISLVNATRNSVKCQVPEITLRSRDIRNLQIIRSVNKPTQSFAVIGQNESSAFFQPSSANSEPKCNNYTIDENLKKKNDSKKKLSKRTDSRKWMSERDEACFNAPLDSDVLDTEFDFEKNLALFDKQAVYDEINALSKSDSNVRLVDCNRRSQPKYRHDENVLVSDAPVLKQISVPCYIGKEYVTDSGLVVPCVTQEYKEKLFKKAEDAGLSVAVRVEMIGRAASEIVLQLLGGNHRLNPQNTHQRPTVVILSGAHIQGAQGVNCGRHLANHCVNVTVLCPPDADNICKIFRQELKLFSLSGGKKTSDVTSLPSTVDIIIGCLESHRDEILSTSNWSELIRQWATHCKGPVLCLDPPADSCSLEQKWILTPVFPFDFKKENCSIYICDIGIPKGIFSSVGTSYISPFGSKFIIPLYKKTK